MIFTRAPKVSLTIVPAIALLFSPAKADEGGVSFWTPGTYASLSASPQQPGWSLTAVYYFTSVSAGAAVSTSRALTTGDANADLSAGLNSPSSTLWVTPAYVFAAPVLGGQAALSLTGSFGEVSTTQFGTLAGAAATSSGDGAFGQSGDLSDSVWGFGDLYPQFSLRWNAGVNSVMTYITGDAPVGAYDPARLSNIGIGHAALDAGAGYTYYDEASGHEFSGVLGFTYNFLNPSTQYRNGVDMHFDWGASQFLNPQWEVGIVGYVYDQITADGGAGDQVGAFKSRVLGAGPQISYSFPVGDLAGFLNLRAYKEFDAAHRPDGFNVWLTFAISPTAPPPAQPARATRQ